MRVARDDAKEFDYVCQRDGDVFVACMPDDVIMVPRADTIQLLTVVLAALRIEGDAEKLELAAKLCRSNIKQLAGAR